MSRRSAPTIEFDALAIEGGLLPPEWLSRVAALQAGAQAPADYDIKKGLQLRDEITRYWRIAEALWAELDSARAQRGHDEGAVTHAFVRQLLTDVFGFDDLAAAGEREVEGRRFPIDFEGRGGGVPVVVGRPGEGLDQSVPRHGDGVRRRSAWGALQEYLNAEDGVLWGIVCNGPRLRLGRDNASLTRPAWLEADLERIFAEERFADFSVLWLTLHASRFGRPDQPPEEAPLEAWRAEARERGSRARKELRTGVEAALLELGQGFLAHPDNAALRDQLASGALTPQEYFNELLRLVYRVIFLLTVEEREILHPEDAIEEARTLYTDGYGLRRLRERAVRRAGYDRHTDLWASLRPVFSALGRPRGEPALGLRGLGGLFAPEQCPHLDVSTLENRSLLTVLFRLAWIREGDALARVNWRDMGPEELGSVYESLLELVPLVSDDGRRFTFAGADESAGNARKLTGSYYTPDELVQELLDSALEPVVSERLAAQPQDQERALLSITVIDPACGSGHFLLAAARRLATHLARVRSGGTPGAEEYRHALRDVVTHCIHGVDRNPMALELARMALWLEAYTPDRALGFLDHHLVCGDALVGLLDLGVLRDGIPDDAYKALTGDDNDVVKILRKLNREGRKALEKRKTRGELSLQLGAHTLAEAFAQLDELGDEGVESVEAKRARYAELRADAEESPVALAADLYLAAFLMPKTLAPGERELTDSAAAARFPATATLGMALEGTLGTEHSLAQAARRTCRHAQVLHWPLAFPQVFERGGFDVVLGNPPWETMSPERREYFSRYIADIASLAPEEQEERVAELLNQPEIASEWDGYCRDLYAAVLFMKEGRRYTRYAKGNLGKGDFNVYRQFVELALDATRPGGFAAQIVPENFYNGANASAIRASMFHTTELAILLGFENHRGYWFPGVDTRMKFALYATRTGGVTDGFPARFSIRNPAELDRARQALLHIGVAIIREFSPDALSVMEFSNQYELDTCTKMYEAFPHFGEPIPGEPYRHYMAEVHMGNHNHLFRADRDGLPVYQGSMVTHFDYRAKAYVSGHGRATVWRELPFGAADKGIHPQWYIPAEAIPESRRERVHSYRIGFCDVGNATNQRALMAALIPPGTVCGHKVPTIQLDDASSADVMLWVGVANSLPMDFLVRMKIALTMSTSLLDTLPLPRSVRSCPEGKAVAALAARLTLAGSDMAGFRERLENERELSGHCLTPSLDPDARSRLEAELNARVAAEIYGLSRSELRYILDPVDVLGPEVGAETFRSLRDQEMRAYGEYRTRRLVLEAWDALAEGRLLPSQLDTFVEALQTRPAAKPSLNPADDAALSVTALVLAAGGSLSPSALVRSYGLRNHPRHVVQNAQAPLRTAAQAWAERRGSNPGPSLIPVLQRLMDGGQLVWQMDGGIERISATPSTPAESRLSPWHQYEARLLLAVADAIPESQAAMVDAELPAADRTLLRAVRA